MPRGLYKRTKLHARGMLGKNHSEESKRKMSVGHKDQSSPRGMLGKKHSLETRQKISESARGEKHPNWKGGISTINEKVRKSLEYKLWREAVFARDNYQCIWGGKEHGTKIQADHIKPFALYPELRFAIDNGRTLCDDCHKKTETYGKRTQEARWHVASSLV